MIKRYFFIKQMIEQIKKIRLLEENNQCGKPREEFGLHCVHCGLRGFDEEDEDPFPPEFL